MERKDLMIEEIHEIRLKTYEKTKNMSNEEQINFTKKKAASAIKRMQELPTADDFIFETTNLSSGASL